MKQRNKIALLQWAQPSLLSLAVAAGVTHAAPGDLDTSFAGKGWTTSEIGNLKDAKNLANDTVIIPSSGGKILTVGSDNNGNNDDLSISRFNANGSLDTTFDGDGKILLSLGNGAETGYSIIVQADGKFVVAGLAAITRAGGSQDTDVLLARYNADGTPDVTFGTNGIVTTNFSGDDVARDVIQQADNKLVITGSAVYSNSDIIVARYNTDGTLDTTFDTDGKANIGVLAGDDLGYSIVQQTDTKLAITGTAFNGLDTDMAVVRLNNNGSLDTSFDSDGKLTKATGSVVLNPSAAVTISQASPANITWSAHGLAANTLVKFTTTGTLPAGLSVGTDYYVKTVVSATQFTVSSTQGGTAINTTSAGTGVHTGTATVTSGADDRAFSIIQQTDGKLVIAGDASINNATDFVMARFLSADGAKDTTFGADGFATTDIAVGNDTAYAVIQQPSDGKLVAAGVGAVSSNNDIAIVRYNTDGSLDNSFSGDGKQTAAVNLAGDFALALALQSDGMLLVAGKTTFNSADDIALARFDGAGVLDSSFGVNGKATIAGGATDSSAYAITTQTDGKIVAAGSAYMTSTGYDFALARYNANGSLDTSFDADGLTTTAFGSTITEYPNSVIQLKKSQITPVRVVNITVASPAVVSATANSIPVNTAITFTTTGALPAGLSAGATYYVKTIVSANTFNVSSTPGGAAINTTAAGTGVHTVATMSAIPSAHQGKLIAAGYRLTTGTNYDITLSRYNSNGSLDTTFNTTGKYNTGISTTNYDVINDIIELNTGQYMAAGYINSSTAVATSSDFALMRFNSNGSKDNSFNGVANKTTNVSQLVFGSTNRDQAQSLIEDNNGKIVVAGSAINSATVQNHEVAITRHNADGSLDTAFGGGDGVVTTDMSAGDDIGYEVKQDSNNKYVVVGTSNDNFAVVRYNNNGSLDTSFGSGTGFVSIPVGTNIDNAFSLVLQPDGKIVVGGFYNFEGLNRPVIVRLLPDGTLDSTFATTGKKPIPMAKTTVIRGIDVQNDGKYLLAGSTTGSTDFFVARLLIEDGDGDGFGDNYDNCPVNANANQADLDADGLGDVCDPDADGDTVADTIDNCLLLANTNQLDTDGDLQGNACDTDDDNDGVLDVSDAFPLNAAESVDTDGDGIGNNADGDDDGDGAADTVDTDPLNAAVSTEIDLPLNSNYDGATVKDSQGVQ